MSEIPAVSYSREATLAKLLALKERPRRETETVHVPGIDADLELRKLPLAEYMELDNRLAETDAGSPEFIRALAEKIYAFIPLLHEQQLQEAYDCRVPSDIVSKLLQDDLGDWTFLGAAINRMYGLGREDGGGETPQQTVKN